MPFLRYGTGFFWLICYFLAIWICVIGKKNNPNKGWNYIIAAEIIYMVALLPSLYYTFLVDDKLPIFIFLLKISKYVYNISWLLILPVGMILSLVGLYYIAQGKKKTSRKAIKKRRGK